VSRKQRPFGLRHDKTAVTTAPAKERKEAFMKVQR